MGSFLIQRSLFPEAFEIEADALEALEELDVQRGLERILEARGRDPDLANLDELQSALEWLRGRSISERPTLASVAAAFVALRRAELAAAAKDFAERALARYAVRHADRIFLDAEDLLPRAVMELVLGRGESARRELVNLVRVQPDRADLWGWLGAACQLADRSDEANACAVTALVLEAARVDLQHSRNPRLGTLFVELCAVHPEASARELLLVHGWLQGILTIPLGNDWLLPQESRLRTVTVVRPGAPEPARLRRFAFLFYLDRTRGAACDLEDREEMHALEPQLMRRVLAVLREREGRR